MNISGCGKPVHQLLQTARDTKLCCLWLVLPLQVLWNNHWDFPSETFASLGDWLGTFRNTKAQEANKLFPTIKRNETKKNRKNSKLNTQYIPFQLLLQEDPCQAAWDERCWWRHHWVHPRSKVGFVIFNLMGGKRHLWLFNRSKLICWFMSYFSCWPNVKTQ